MPPKPSGATAPRRGRPSGKQNGATNASASVAKRKRSPSAVNKATSSRADRSDGATQANDKLVAELESLETKQKVAVSAELLRRMLHEMSEDKGMRMTQEASAGFARYIDLFLREAIQRTADEKKGVFLEVEALETAAPQLLLDF